MRQYLALLALVSAAHAEPLKIDADKVDVWRDDNGRYYVLPKRGTATLEAAREVTFYGDGRTLYQQRVVAFSTSGGAMSLTLWSPRVRRMPNALIEIKADATSVICEMKSSKYVRKPLVLLGRDDATKLLASAVVQPPLWKHRPVFLGRGKLAEYYLLDELVAGDGHRLFIGAKGGMKQKAITDYTKDSTGQSIVMNKVEFQIPTGGKSAVLIQGKRRVEVTPLDVNANQYLIYRELGVYGQLGTVCEDQ